MTMMIAVNIGSQCPGRSDGYLDGYMITIMLNDDG